MRYFFAIVFFIVLLSLSQAQQHSYYTLLQGGGHFGFANEGYKGAFNGYAMHFIFGRNYNERAYLGVGLGNERFSGRYQTNDPHQENQERYSYTQNLFPLFIDVRLPIGVVGDHSKLGVYSNAGYAPRLSAMYDKGFLFKGGFFYLHERPGRTDWMLSAGYGYQQLTKNIFLKDFQHQHFNVTVGIMLK